MEDNLEIYFCEVCNSSVPESELASQQAVRVKGKIIGSCCLPELRPAGGLAARSTSSGPTGVSSFGLTAVGAIVLAGVAGATVFLDARMSKELDAVRKVRNEMRDVRTSVASQGKMWADLDKRIDNTMQRDGLEPLKVKVAALETKIEEGQGKLGSEIRGVTARFALIEEGQTRLGKGQDRIGNEIKDVQLEVVRLGAEMAKQAAMPRPAAVNRAASGDARPADAAKVARPAAAVPADLAEDVARLKDEDAGNRFEAVDQLIQSKNPAALGYLLPMLKDGDAFVRRLTAEGLARFKHVDTVDALLVALGDPEPIVRHTTHASLKKLTGQSISFDPDGSSSSRNAAQRRWKDWWGKNRDKF